MNAARRLFSVMLVSFGVLVGGLAFVSAPALAGVGFGFSSSFNSPGGFAGPVGLAVDDAASGLSKGDVYVADQGHNTLDKFTASGGFLEEVALPGAAPNQITFADYSSLTEGDVYVAGHANGVVYKYSAGLHLESEVKGFDEPTGVAVDEAGDMFVSEDAGNAGDARVLEVNAAGEPVNAAGTPSFDNTVVEGTVVEGPHGPQTEELNGPQALAVSANGEYLYVATATGTFQYTISGDTYVRMNASNDPNASTIDPESSTGVSLTPSGDVLVDQGREIAEYQASGALLARFGGGVLSSAYGVGLDAEAHHAYAADNAAGAVDVFEAGETPAEPSTGSASAVTGTTATLEGTLNAGDGGTSGYYFQYNTGASCEGASPAEVALTTTPGAATGGGVHTEVTGLEPHKQYVFCLLATNRYGSTAGAPEPLKTLSVPPKIEAESFSDVLAHSVTLTTQINPEGTATEYDFEYGTSTAYGSTTQPQTLGEGRAGVSVQTQVSDILQPATTYHFRVVATNADGETARGSDITFTTFPAAAPTLPDGRVYEMVTPVSNEDAEAYVPYPYEGYEPGGGALTQGIATKNPFQVAVNGDAVAYLADPTAGGDGRSGVNFGDEYLATRPPEGGWSQVNIQPQLGGVAAGYQAFSGDLSLGFLHSNASRPLVASAPPETGENQRVEYMRTNSDGKYYVLHGGSEAAAEAYAGSTPNGSHVLFASSEALAAGAIVGQNNLYDLTGGQLYLVSVLPDGASATGAEFGGADLNHVISSTGSGSRIFWQAGGVLYARENDASTVQLDATQGGSGSGGGRFWTADSEGSQVFFTDESRLTNDSTAASGAPDLYEYDFAKPADERLTDLTADTNAGEAADVQGVIGASEDGDYVYFVADGSLAAGASADQPNLYLRHDGSTTFITTLAPEDSGDWSQNVGERTAEAAPAGSGLVFASGGNVYVYEAEANSVFCASCSRNGEAGAGGFLPISWSSTYQVRLISEDGSQVFFDSSTRLSAQDTGGAQNVYEWERAGTGGCTESAGCIYLLSGGGSSNGSWLIGASASGDDLFIVTRAQLVPEDQNETFDVYDVRVDGRKPLSPPACSGTGCQGVPPPPPIFATPSSVTFNGVGNFTAPTTATVKSKAKPPTRAQQLAKALKACKKKRAHKRLICEAQARGRYGAKPKTKKTAKGRK